MSSSIGELISAILIFLFVLALACVTTRLTAGFQKQKLVGRNVEVIETFKLSQGKYIQIIRLGEKYAAIAVCKDTVTMLGELDKDEIALPESDTANVMSFQDILDKAKGMTHKK